MCVCVCFLPIHSARVTQEEGHTGFFIHLLSAYQPGSHTGFFIQLFLRALLFLAKMIQPFLSLVDQVILHQLSIFTFIFIYFFSEKNPVCRDRTHVPSCQKERSNETGNLIIADGSVELRSHTHRPSRRAEGILVRTRDRPPA